MEEYSQVFKINGVDIQMSTGKLATLAQGSVLLKMGGTVLLATAAVEKKDAEQDFFPLSVEYIEKMYARGAISGSRFEKREGFPADEAIIKARQVDHSIRSLFPKSYKKPLAVVLTVLAYDQENDPEVLAVLGASTALMLSGVPYYGPSSSVVACVDGENIVINPKAEGRENHSAEFLLSGVDDKMLNIEGWAKEVSDETMDRVLDEAMKVIKEMNKAQRDFTEGYRKSKNITVEAVRDEEEYSDLPAPEALIEQIKHYQLETIRKGLFVEKDKDTNRQENLKVLKDLILSEQTKARLTNPEIPEYTPMQIDLAVEYVARKVVRDAIMTEGKRVTNRGLEEIRPLNAEVDLLPTVHGSALFERGLTQSLSIVTLGSLGKELLVDDMEGESSKTFMHHYNMPSFSTGEAGRYSYRPGRREIGHGAIGENALRNMVPSQEEFPYTIRVVSEVLTSNGSTSMAATCASSMALMASGVPMKKAVAGIGVGLVTEPGKEDVYKLLLDIEGIEDFYGDMDFKVTGTSDGITAIQYENKLRGVKLPILKETFRLAKKGRLQVLEVMNKAISAPRDHVSENAPMVDSIQIKQDKIGALIGPGGKNIKEIVQNSAAYGKAPADINIDDTGKVVITASNKHQMDYVINLIDSMIGEAEIGKLYGGTVDKIMPYGVFVNVTSNISGLLHVSEIFERQGNFDLSKTFQEGDQINVKVLKNEDGRINFTLRGVEQNPEMAEKLKNPVEGQMPMPETRNSRFQDSRGGGRRPERRPYRD